MPTVYVIDGPEQARLIWALDKLKDLGDIQEALRLLESALEFTLPTEAQMRAFRLGLDIGFGTEGYALLEPEERDSMLLKLKAYL